MPAARRRSLYVCYLSLDDPLVHSQVVAYLAGLASHGHQIHLLTFEVRRLTRAARRERRRQLAARGIHWHGRRYHKRPSLPATVFDVLSGGLTAAWLVRRHRLDTLHARNHVPAAMGLIARWLLARDPPALVFDIRGLMAEEYVDAGRWSPGGAPWRLTKWVERRAIARADGIVVLTERIRHALFDAAPRANVRVIPCCTDVPALAAGAGEAAAARRRLGLPDGPVLVYAGKFGGWYQGAEMARCFARGRELIPGLHFLILTQSDRREIEPSLDRLVPAGSYTITSAAPEDIGAHLSLAVAGICFIEPAPSKASSSPTKLAEYLACGLPVLATAGVGDLDRLVDDAVGVLVPEHSAAAHDRALRALSRLIDDPETPAACRALADSELSLERVGIPRYRALYEALPGRAAPGRRSRPNTVGS